MKFKLAGILLATLLVDAYVPPAEACGVKLAIKHSRPRRAAAHTSRPSHLLLVGSPPKRLEHDLSAAGHDVEVVASPSTAKRQEYEVVVVASNDQAQEAKAKFPRANVVVRSGDINADVSSVENQVARRPVGAAEGRQVVAAGPTREVVGARTSEKQVDAKAQPRTEVNAKEQGAEPVASTAPPAPSPTPKQVATPTKAEEPTKPAKVEPTKPAKAEPAKPATKVAAKTESKTEEPSASEEPKPKAIAGAKLAQEAYFALGAATISDKSSLDKAVKFLKDHSDLNAVIEGHADPSGTHEGNMALSQSRAEFARDYLVSEGIDTSRLEVKPLGDTKLKYGKGDARNRRIAIVAK